MLDTTEAYRAANEAPARRTRVLASVDITDPDLVIEGVDGADQSVFSLPEQLTDKVFDLDRMETLEINRVLLDGSFRVFADDYATPGAEVGAVSENVSGADGTFATPLVFTLRFSGVDLLQACEVRFSGDSPDGTAKEFTVEILQSGTAYHTETFTDNAEAHVVLSGFAVYNADAIRVTVSAWSLPFRRARIAEIVPGTYERWDHRNMSDIMVSMAADPSCVSLPYGTCDLTIDNTDRKFEPRNKNGLFLSLQDRQAVDVQIGILVNGAYDWKNVGRYYQYNGGWKTSDNGMLLKWSLVDILGLLADREFIPPATLPTTLGAWVGAVVRTLGPNFEETYHVDPAYTAIPLTAAREDLIGLKCGALLRYVCMASGTWPRADAETGKLAVEPLWEQGNAINLDNMEKYPETQANEALGQIAFTLSTGETLVVGGTNAAASKSINIKNPFLHTEQDAFDAAQRIITHYGGDRYDITGRGDPSTEIGDVDTVQLDESRAATGRVTGQTFRFRNGLMRGCETTLIQATGRLTYTTREQLEEDTTWTVPTGVTSVFAVLVGGGNGGTQGEAGSWFRAGEAGADGSGAKIWYGTIPVTPGASLAVVIGSGGEANGGAGGNTTFGTYTSANGAVFRPAYTDLVSGSAFGRSGVTAPLANSGDGGRGGRGGVQGRNHTVSYKDDHGFVHYRTVTDQRPGAGSPGAAGGSGCVILYYDET